MLGQRGGPDNARIFAQRRETNFDLFGFKGPDVFVKITLDPREQFVTGGNHPAGKNNPSRFRRMQHINTQYRQRLGRPFDDVNGDRVPVCGVFKNIF